MLKRIATEGGVRAFPAIILVLDYLEDGQIDGFGLLQNAIGVFD